MRRRLVSTRGPGPLQVAFSALRTPGRQMTHLRTKGRCNYPVISHPSIQLSSTASENLPRSRVAAPTGVAQLNPPARKIVWGQIWEQLTNHASSVRTEPEPVCASEQHSRHLPT